MIKTPQNKNDETKTVMDKDIEDERICIFAGLKDAGLSFMQIANTCNVSIIEVVAALYPDFNIEASTIENLLELTKIGLSPEDMGSIFAAHHILAIQGGEK